jgi:hypothetical protein
MKFNYIFIIITIIIFIYICCYFIFPPSVQILQTTISDFNFPLLYTRQPIVIYDCVKEKEELIDSWFKYNSIYKINNHESNENQEWVYNRYKYLFITANIDTEVIIYKASIYSAPPKETDSIIAIKLQKDQSLILPYRWKYFVEKNTDINVWGINDLITSFVSLVF